MSYRRISLIVVSFSRRLRARLLNIDLRSWKGKLWDPSAPEFLMVFSIKPHFKNILRHNAQLVTCTLLWLILSFCILVIYLLVNVLVIFDGWAFGVITRGGWSRGKTSEQTAGILLLTVNKLLHKTFPEICNIHK